MAGEYRDDGSDRNRRVSRERFYPPDVELPPQKKCGPCPFEIGFPASDCNQGFVEAADTLTSCNANRAVREMQSLRVTDEPLDGLTRWTLRQEHHAFTL